MHTPLRVSLLLALVALVSCEAPGVPCQGSACAANGGGSGGGGGAGPSNGSSTRPTDYQWNAQLPTFPQGLTMGPAVAWDSTQGRAVVLGHNGTFTWADGTWTRLPVGPGPGAVSTAMVWDSGRHKVVAFDGAAGATWELDAAGWTRTALSTSPDAQSRFAMAYDPARARVVLVDGYGGGGTREYSNGSWSPVGQAPGQYTSTAAFHPGLGRVVLLMASGILYQWDGSTWDSMGSSPGAGGYDESMVYASSRGKLLLATARGSTLEWDGQQWTNLGLNVDQVGHATAVYDAARTRVLRFSEVAAAVDVLGPAGTWQRVQNAPTASAVTAYDEERKALLAFGLARNGVTNETWTWNNNGWTLRGANLVPERFRADTLTWDPVRKVLWLIGHEGGTFSMWQWDGAQWTQKLAASSPLARVGRAAAFDRARGTLLLFGGGTLSATGSYGTLDPSSTWEWNGTTWLQPSTSANPPPRYGARMAYDERAQLLRLVGGGSLEASQWRVSDDAWEWTAQGWKAAVLTPVLPRTDAGLAWHPGLQRMVLSGGRRYVSRDPVQVEDTWTLESSGWVQHPIPGPGGQLHWAGDRLVAFSHGALHTFDPKPGSQQ